MCHVLCKKHAFWEVVDLLELGKVQVERFLTMYLVERKVWELYDGNVDNIPWRELAAEAAREIAKSPI